MNERQHTGLLRCVVVWAAVTLASAALATVALDELVAAQRVLRTGDGTPPFDQLLVGLCALGLLVCATWFWLTTSTVVVAILSASGRGGGPRTRVFRPSVPSWLHRAVLAACGVAGATALGLAVPATATPGSIHVDRADRDASVVAGLPMPDRPSGGTRPASTDPAPARTYEVRTGDALWTIAAEHLGPRSTAAQIAELATRLYDLNREVVGPDPDLIRPGHQLRMPR